MANICEFSKKPEISYPNFWCYRVIINSDKNAGSKIKEKLAKYEYEISLSKHSKNGKYISFEVNVMVNSELERDLVFKELKEISKFVL